MQHKTDLGPLIIDLEGLTLTEEEKIMVQHPDVGGIILFSRNYKDPEQLQQLVASLRELRDPLLITVDQEGGSVQRFKNDFSLLPPLGALPDEPTAQQHAHLMALEVRACGIDLSFTPVLDRNNISVVIKDRSFSNDPNEIIRKASAYMAGMKLAGMKATGKHFPGHGSIKPDSHYFLPEDPRTLAEIQDDLAPFEALIKEGIPALMMAHIIYPNIDALPVGFSTYWLQNILRNKLGFEGAIISDDLCMKGADTMGDFPLRAQRALDAGCDFILICNDRAVVNKTLGHLNYENSPETLQRRAALLGEGERAHWAKLSCDLNWQTCKAALSTV